MKKLAIIVIIVLTLCLSFFLVKDYSAEEEFVASGSEEESCLLQTLPEDEFSDELYDLKQEILNLYSDSNADTIYEDLTDGYTIEILPDEVFYAASVNKLPLVYYAYKLADDGDLDLDKEFTYTKDYYHDGSGIIQYEDYGTTYTLNTLLEYTIKYSDNVAYDMLASEIGLDNVKEYWEEIGYEIEYSDNFGYLSARGASIYLKEVYNYYLTGSDNAIKLIEDMEESDEMDSIKDDDSYEVAHKYGYYSDYYHDISIVFTDNPYSLSILSTMGDTDEKDEFFLKSHKLFKQFNELYWEEKEEYCG